jgi:hypothetical protein
MEKNVARNTNRTSNEVLFYAVVSHQRQHLDMVSCVPHPRYVTFSSHISVLTTVADTPRTERWDYFSAGLAILSALYVTVIRIFHLYPKRHNPLTSPHPPSPTPRRLWFTLCLFAYLGHIGYLGLSPRFDYSYNVAANLTVGMIHNLLWLLFSLPLPILTRYPNRPRSYMPPFAKKAAAFVGMTTLAMGLELFDFAPWARTIDAHSLWHLATAPIASYWYGFIVQDCVDESWRMDVVGSRLT